ncbi:hypothetical protein E3T38_01200 [Cryobacterium sp. Hb1]|nr:hypothetical protein E3T38_01200 [Cryobacterium sp. Hb1]
MEHLRGRVQRFREHYNKRRPHQALEQATPRAAWDLLKHKVEPFIADAWFVPEETTSCSNHFRSQRAAPEIGV